MLKTVPFSVTDIHCHYLDKEVERIGQQGSCLQTPEDEVYGKAKWT